MWRPFTPKPARGKRRKEIDIWRLQALFNNFRRILFLNNAILEDMANMERALGGEYVFDRAYLDSSIRAIASRVHHVTYNLNALTDNAYIALYDRYQEIRTTLDDILSGNTATLTGWPVLPLHAIGWELEPLVGLHLVCLAEVGHHPDCRIADGFVVTTEGTRALIGSENQRAEKKSFSTAEVRADIAERLEALVGDRELKPLSLVITELDGEEGMTREIGEFFLIPEGGELRVRITEETGLFAQLGISSFDLDALSAEPLAVSSKNFIIEPYLRTLNRLLPFFFARLHQAELKTTGRYTLFFRLLPPIALTGTIRTSGGPAGEAVSIVAQLADIDGGEDMYLLRRIYPFDLVQSHIAPRPAGFRFPEGKLATSQAAASFGRGSALVDRRTLKKLAETAMALERMLGGPAEVRWELPREGGSVLITSLLPLPLVCHDVPLEELEREKAAATPLARGGQMVQSGVAAGSIVHVTEEMPAADFPAGAVAVARMASPQLTPILQKAAAIITEYGNTTGHLATVARELRLPALFGLKEALAALPPETEVTVDTGEKTVYGGVLEARLRQAEAFVDFSPFDPEYRMLRRLLRFIMPLRLVNPEAPDFTPEGCRSFHDIIHFCHEKAVDELAHFQERHPQLGSIRTRKMRLDIPMDIRVLDIGGGISAAEVEEPAADQVQSGPFAAFLGGLLDPRAQKMEPPTLALRDILSGMPRTMGLLAGPTDTLGENLAIVSHDYLNLSLRLGYHFSVIDAHLGTDGHRNYVYFRFIGGLADQVRRNRRAKFICDVLKVLDFKVTVKGDLVIGRMKLTQTALLRSALFVLGALTTFSRQRDTGLYSDADTEALFSTFFSTFLAEHRQRAS